MQHMLTRTRAQCGSEVPFPLAVFERGDESWDDAFRQTHERYLAAVGAAGASRVLVLLRAPEGDAGGSGPVSPRFVPHDVLRIGELEGRFGAALVLDAACCLPDKRSAFTRLRERLEPGAKLLLVDWCKREGLSSTQERFVLDPLLDDGSVKSLETPARYQRHLAKAGFSVLEVDDLTERARPSWEGGYRQALAEHRAASTPPTEADAPEPALVAETQAQLNQALRLRAGFASGFLRYMWFLAEAAP